MQRVITFSLVLLLLLVPIVNAEAKQGPKRKHKNRKKKIIINSAGKQVTIDLSLNFVQPVTKFIHLHVNNQTDEDKILRLQWKEKFASEQLQTAVRCVFQNRKNSGSDAGSIVPIEKELIELDSGEIYNGWLKIEFTGLDQWWQVTPGTHRGQLAVIVKSD